MGKFAPGSPSDDGIEALAHLEQALLLLDRMDAPGEIGALVDHAIQKLRSTLIPNDSGDGSRSAE
jgi:hypothetical protein